MDIKRLLQGCAAALITVGLTASAAAETPCTKDAECPGDQICVGGQCIDAPTDTPTDPPPTPPADPPTPADPPPTPPTEPPAPVDPPPTPPAPAGCQKDTDCKGERICENGECVTPAAEPEPTKPGDTKEKFYYSGGKFSFTLVKTTKPNGKTYTSAWGGKLFGRKCKRTKITAGKHLGAVCGEVVLKGKVVGKKASGSYQGRDRNRKRMKGSWSARTK